MPRRDTLIAGLLVAVLVAVLLPAARLGVDQHHDGIMLKPALDVLSGQALFRDTFTQYGALTTYLQVVALKVQPTLASLRFMTVAAYAIALCFLYAAWRLILPRPLAVLSAGMFILFIPVYEKDWLGQQFVLLPWSSVFALMFQAIALQALFNLIRDAQANRNGLILGAACAAVFWCRQPVGVVMTGCVGASWVALHFAGWSPAHTTKRAILARMLAGFALVHAPLLGSLVATHAVPEWWYQNFVWPGKWAQVMKRDVPFIMLYPRAAAGLFLLFVAVAGPALLAHFQSRQVSRRGLVAYYLGLAVLLAWQHEQVLALLALRSGGWSVLLPVLVGVQALAGLALVFRKRNAPHPTEHYLVAALAALALGSLLQYFPLSDPWHVMWSLSPAFGLAVHILWRWSRGSALAVTLVLAAALLPAVWFKVQSAREALAQPLVTLDHPAVLRGMRVLPGLAQRLDRILTLQEQIVRHRPDMPSAVIGNDALFLCFAPNLTNPTPYYVTWYGLAEDEENQRRWNYIHANRPLMYLHRARWNAVADFYRKERYVPILYFPEDALEVAVPQEIADALGITTYGAPRPGGAASPAVKN